MARLRVVGEKLKLKSLTVLIFPNRPTLLGEEATQQARQLGMRWVTASYLDLGDNHWVTRITLHPHKGRPIRRTMELIDPNAERTLDGLQVYLKGELNVAYMARQTEQYASAASSRAS